MGSWKSGIQGFLVLPHSALLLFSQFKSEFTSLFLTCLGCSYFPEGGQSTETLICFHALVLHCERSKGLQGQYWLASEAAQGSQSVGEGSKGMLRLLDFTLTHTVRWGWFVNNEHLFTLGGSSLKAP